MERAEFRNDSPGIAGAVAIEDGKRRGITVKPNESVWLSEEEQIATANAPRKDEDNPFVNGTFTLVTDPQQVANRRPLGHSSLPQVPTPEAAQAKADAKAKQAQAKQAEEAKRAEKAKAQAEQGVTPVKEQKETGAAAEPQGEAAQGSRPSGEEVGTPEAAEAKEGAAATA
jgi:hypothetical protein